MVIKHSLYIPFIAVVASLSIFPGCKTTDSLLGLDSSPIEVIAKGKSVRQTSPALLAAMQYHGYTVDKETRNTVQFRREIKGILSAMSFSADLQQEDVVNCILLEQGKDTKIGCRTYNEAVDSKGKLSRSEKTQSIGYRSKLERELATVNQN